MAGQRRHVAECVQGGEHIGLTDESREQHVIPGMGRIDEGEPPADLRPEVADEDPLDLAAGLLVQQLQGPGQLVDSLRQRQLRPTKSTFLSPGRKEKRSLSRSPAPMDGQPGTGAIGRHECLHSPRAFRPEGDAVVHISQAPPCPRPEECGQLRACRVRSGSRPRRSPAARAPERH